MSWSLDPNVVWIDDINEVRLYIASTSEFRTLNETGAAIWRLLVEGSSLSRIVEALAETYNAANGDDRLLLQRDAEEFISQLMQEGVIFTSEPVPVA